MCIYVYTCVYMYIYACSHVWRHISCTLCIFVWKLTVFDHSAFYLLRQKTSLDPEPDSSATVARQLAPGVLPPFLSTGIAGKALQTPSLGSGDPNFSLSTCPAHALSTTSLPQHVSRLFFLLKECHYEQVHECVQVHMAKDYG